MYGDVVYHCLSYTWGDESPEHEILLNGQTFLIRKNLDAALRAVRHPVSNIVLWIDAVCIDQDNDAERSRQIPRMLEIYEAADCVLSWAGGMDDAAETALGLLSDLKSPKLQRSDNSSWEVNLSEQFPRRLAALYRFLQRPYFRRIWVIQEIAVASLPTIYCGHDKQVAWQDLDMAAYHLVDVLHRDPDMARQMMEADTSLDNVSAQDLMFVRRLFYFRHLRVRGQDTFPFSNQWANIRDQSPGMLDLVVLGRDFESSCAHDKIFALWGLALDKEGIDMTPDYSRSLSQTYLDFTFALAKHTNNLDSICSAEPSQNSSLDMPSWCADWRTPSEISSLIRREHIPNVWMTIVNDLSGPVYRTAGQPESLNPMFDFDGKMLSCAGVVTDTVSTIGPYDPEAVESFMEWLSIVCEEGHYNGEALPETKLMTAFWSMLAGDVSGVWESEEVSKSGEDGHQHSVFGVVCRKEKECRFRNYNTSDHVHDIVTRGRRLIITEHGYMGLAPHYVQKGQRLAILSGCSVPVLLEEIEDGSYRFIGSCFVQGWMKGEMLLQYGTTAEEAWSNLGEAECLQIV